MSEPDEAQQRRAPASQPKPTEVSEFSIVLSMGASVEVNGQDWMKPHASGGMKWKGIPTKKEIESAAKYITATYLEPQLIQMLDLTRQKLVEKQMTQ